MATTKLGPELEVVNDIIRRCAELNLFLYRVESSAVLNERIGRYLHSQAPKGFPDISGYNMEGRAVFVEAKAPGRLFTIREDQYRFLRTAIRNNCFAVCVDSYQLLAEHVKQFGALASQGIESQKDYLTKALPLTKLAKKRGEQHDFSTGVIEF